MPFTARLLTLGLGPQELDPELVRVEDHLRFCMHAFLRVGVRGSDRSQDQRLLVASPQWLAEKLPENGVLRGQGLVLQTKFDGAALRVALEHFLNRCSGATPDTVFAKTARLGFSEFEDFNEPPIPPFFLDPAHEEVYPSDLAT